MKSKKEIIKEEYEKYFSSPSYDKSVNKKMNENYIFPAMDEYAEQFLLHFLNSNFIDKLPAGSYTNRRVVQLFQQSVNQKQKL